jgi:hypothetical protein
LTDRPPIRLELHFYAALAWYYDHQREMDAEISQQDERVQALRDAAPPSPLQRRLAASRRSK